MPIPSLLVRERYAGCGRFGNRRSGRQLAITGDRHNKTVRAPGSSPERCLGRTLRIGRAAHNLGIIFIQADFGFPNGSEPALSRVAAAPMQAYCKGFLRRDQRIDNHAGLKILFAERIIDLAGPADKNYKEYRNAAQHGLFNLNYQLISLTAFRTAFVIIAVIKT